MAEVRILIVEDEAIVARDIRWQLTELGYVVAGDARRGDEAVARCGELRPDLVLMDIHLAGEMDGIQAAGLIRKQFALPVVFLTAFADDPIISRAKTAEPYGYVVKPFDERELRTVIEMALYKHRAEIRQRENDEELAAIVRTAMDGFWVVDRNGRILEVNDAACAIHGYSREEMLARSVADLSAEGEAADIGPLMLRVELEGEGRVERRHRHRDGRLIHLEFSCKFRPGFGGRFIAFLRDVTASKLAQEITQVRLRISEFSANHSLEALLQKTLDEAEALTGSVIGFFHFVEADQQTLRLQTWSTNTLARMCTAEGKGQHYSVDKAGVWVDCVRERRPVIHNDYANLPHRKGLPAGHAPVIRELVVPVIRDGQLVAIFGVGNKPCDYVDADVESLLSLANHCWDIIGRKRAEVARQQSEAHIEALVNASTEATFMLDRAGRVLVANPELARRLKQLPEDLVGKCIFDFLPPDLAASRRAQMEKVYATGSAVRFTDFFAGRWVAHHLVPIKDAQGQVTSLAVFGEDITDQKRVVEVMEEEQERLSRLFRTAPVGIAITANRVIGEVNDVFCTILGYAREEMVGQNSRFLYATTEEYERVGESITTVVMKTGHGSIETKWRRKDGAVIDVMLGASLVQWRGGAPALVATALDITGRKKIEVELRDSSDLLQRAQAMAELGYYKLDITTGQWISSPQLDQIFGIGPDYDRSVGGWAILVAPDQRAEMAEYFQKHVLAERGRFEKEYRILRPADGQERWVSGLGELEFDAAGNPIRMIGTIQDITERKTLESQFRQAQKMEVVGQLAGGVAHDFNNILTAMTLNLELLRSSDLPLPAQSPLAEIDAMARRAARLTQQLLMFARRQAMQVTTVDINASLGNLLKMLRRLLGEHVALNFSSTVPALWIEVDAGMLDQVVMNLCINARDAMPGGGTLTLSTELVTLDAPAAAALPEARTGTFVCLAVADTGVGMPPEVVQHLFEPFFTTKDIGKGTGLGLASLHGIVHQHQGWVNVESIVGKGTTFRIFLPWSAKMALPAPGAPAAPADEPLPRGHESILLVEDEAVVRKVGAVMLRRLGYQVVMAADGPEALRLWDEHAGAFDLLFADMVMPGGLTGLQLGETLRKRKPALKVVLMSGYSAEIIEGEALSLVDFAFLSKPFEVTALATTVRRCLDTPPAG